MKVLEGLEFHDSRIIESALESFVDDIKEKDDDESVQIQINSPKKEPAKRKPTTIENFLNKINDSGDIENNGGFKSEVEYLATINEKLNAESGKLNITFCDYFMSFFKKTESMNEKMALINEGVRRINERLDIFQMFKKFREIDKLKMLLLEYDQLVLFEGLPRPELTIRKEDLHAAKNDTKEFSRLQLKKAKFYDEQKQKDLMSMSYVNLKKKKQSTNIDQKLLSIYDGIVE